MKISEQNLLQPSADLLISVEESAGSDVMRTVSQRFERSAVLSPCSEAVSVPESKNKTNVKKSCIFYSEFIHTLLFIQKQVT